MFMGIPVLFLEHLLLINKKIFSILWDLSFEVPWNLLLYKN